MEQKPSVLVPVTEKPLEIGVQDNRGKKLLFTHTSILHFLSMLPNEQVCMMIHEQQTLFQYNQLVLTQHNLQSTE